MMIIVNKFHKYQLFVFGIIFLNFLPFILINISALYKLVMIFKIENSQFKNKPVVLQVIFVFYNTFFSLILILIK